MSSVPIDTSHLNEINDIPSVLPHINVSIHRALSQARASGLVLQNTNSLRLLVQKVLPNPEDASNLQVTIVWLCFLDCYFNQINIDRLKETSSLSQYVVSLGIEYLGLADPDPIYSTKNTKKMFNHVISVIVQLNSALTAHTLCDCTLKYITWNPQGSLNYLVVVTTELLFEEHKYDRIVTLYKANGGVNVICSYTKIDPMMLTKGRLAKWYFELARSLFVTKNYHEAYEMLVIVFEIPIDLKGKEDIEELLTVYVITGILLGREPGHCDTNIVRFASLIPINILRMFRSYQSCQLSEFVRLVCLEYVQRSAADSDRMEPEEYIFTRQVVCRLIGIMVGKTHRFKMQKGDDIKDEFEAMKRAVSDLGLEIEDFNEPSNGDLLRQVADIAESNRRLQAMGN